MSNQFHFGLGFTNNLIQIVELKDNSDKYFVTCADEIETEFNFNTLDFSELTINTSDAYNFITHLTKLIKRNKISSKTINIALEASNFSIFHLPIDSSLTEPEFKSHIEWEISTIFPGNHPSSFNIATLELSSNHGVKEILLVVIRKSVISFFEKLFYHLNLEPLIFDNDHFGAIKSFTENYPEFTQQGIDLFGIRTGFIDHSHLDNGILKNYQSQVVNENSNISEYIAKINDFTKPSGNIWFIYGKLATSEAIRHLRNEFPSIRFELLNPFRKMEIGQNLPRRQEFMLDKFYFAPAVGLALRNK